MKNHNKFLVLTLTALIALSTVACSNKKEAPGASAASSSTTEPVATTKETPVERLPVKPDNKDAIEKINALDVPENIKKVFTDNGEFIDTTHHGKVTTLEDFRYFHTDGEKALDYIDGIYTADIDGDEINELICILPTFLTELILHTDDVSGKVTAYIPNSTRFQVAEKGTILGSSGAEANSYYKVTFTDDEMHEDYLGSEYWGTYKIKSEVSKEEYDKFIEPYPLYKMEDCFTELSFTINNGTASNNSDAITKINALDIPENIKKIFTDDGQFIDTTHNEKTTTLKNFQIYYDNEERPIDAVNGVYAIDIDGDGINDLICKVPTYNKSIVFLTNSEDKVLYVIWNLKISQLQVTVLSYLMKVWESTHTIK